MTQDIEWRISTSPIDYEQAVSEMEERVAAIRAGIARELIWLLEHPPLYTAGTSANPADLLAPNQFPVHASGRGGKYTYHGPGQRIGYVLLDLERRGKDIRRFIFALEGWLIDTLASAGIAARREEGRIGIWVGQGTNEAKIGAIGVRVRKWVTLHGFSLNINPDLNHFQGIVPCGIADHGVTSMAQLGHAGDVTMLDEPLRQRFADFLANLQFA